MNRRGRAGTTLVETVVLGTLVSLTLTTMSLFTHFLLTSSRQIAIEGQARMVVARLQELCDRDVGQVSQVATKLDSGVLVWELTLAEGKRIEYRLGARVIERQVRVAGDIEQRDQFQLPPTFRFAVVQSPENLKTMEIRIEREQAKNARAESLWIPTGLRIVATGAEQAEPSTEKKP